MARASQVTQEPVGYKLAPAMTAPTADGDIVDSGQTRVAVFNDSGAPITVTAQAVATMAGLDVADLVVSVADGQTAWIGPFPKTVFGRTAEEADKGRVYVDYSAQAGVTRAVVLP